MIEKWLLCVLVSLTMCSCGNQRVKEYSDAERNNYIENSDLVYEGTIEKIINVWHASRFKAQAQEKHQDLRWLVMFKVKKILKGDYQYDTLGMTVHSPALSFGAYPYSTPTKTYRIYLKSHPSEFTDYIMIGNEWLK